MTLQQRLRRISKICLLPEEDEAMVTNDWERIRSVVLICAFLAEVTGPEEEEVDPRVLNRWIRAKLLDLDYLMYSL
jgi:hypothetical protein